MNRLAGFCEVESDELSLEFRFWPWMVFDREMLQSEFTHYELCKRITKGERKREFKMCNFTAI